MTPYTLFVADIHLQPDPNHPINLAFEHFLKQEAEHAEALYILGDLFEVWIGDDVGLNLYKSIIQQLKQLTDQGLPIYLQYGNRDFLMKSAFWKATGVQFLTEPYKVHLYGADYLILHGDRLCTDDKSYQKMRRIFRNPLVIWLFLKLSQKSRILIGQKMRQGSKQRSQTKAEFIMDVNSQAVRELFKQYPGVKHMVHGHTHRPQHHQIEAENSTLHRWVLGDWQAPSSNAPVSKLLKVSKAGPELIDYP